MSEESQPLRRSEIDYSDFPKNAAYISRADIEGAYRQGQSDAEAEYKDRIEQLEARCQSLSEALHDRDINNGASSYLGTVGLGGQGVR